MTTAVEVEECREPVAEYLFSDFGTAVPRDVDSQIHLFAGRTTGASLLLTGAAILGGLAGTSVGGACLGTPAAFVSVNRTERGAMAPTAPKTSRVVTMPTAESPQPRGDRDEISWAKEHSGLTWDQLGKVFGVSRRAVHMWANGGRLNEANARRLREFSSIVHDIEADLLEVNAEAVRARLLQIEGDGLSVIDRLRRERSAGHSWGAPFGPERLVDAVRTPLRTPVGEADL